MLIHSDKAPRLWIKMSFFITKATPVYNMRPGMTYVPVIPAHELRTWVEHGLVRVALCFTIIRAGLKWAHEGLLWNFTKEINKLGQLYWDCFKCAGIPKCSLNSCQAICHYKTLYQLSTQHFMCVEKSLQWFYAARFIYHNLAYLS